MRLRVALLFLPVAALVGCTDPTTQAAGPEAADRPVLIEWIDGTGSAGQDSIELCVERARSVAEDFAAGEGTLVLERLDSRTANAPTFQHQATLAIPPEIVTDPEGIREHLRDQVKDVFERAKPVFEEPAAGWTEILGALGASGTFLRNRAGERLVYMCSDLLDRRLLALDQIDAPSISRLLTRMRARGEIPTLEGVSVVLDTTSVSARDELQVHEQAAVEAFYRQLVEEGGGTVAGYGAGVGLPPG